MDDSFVTVAGALSWATDQLRSTSDTPRLDAELLLARVTSLSRARILAEGRMELPDEQRRLFHDLVARRARLEPVAYLIGTREFYGLEFAVNRNVLVPRPETELLVDLALRHAERLAPRHGVETARQLRIADIGTGSGCIAVALAVNLPQAFVYAVDVSRDALEVARTNATRHHVEDRVLLVAGDLLAPLDEPVDLLVSNPPYTIVAEITEGVRRHEPHLALDGGPDGLNVYRRLLAQAPAKLIPRGVVLLEIGATQAAAVAQMAGAHFPASVIKVHQDLAGRDRVVEIVSLE